jgi:hypothetical protein
MNLKPIIVLTLSAGCTQPVLNRTPIEEPVTAQNGSIATFGDKVTLHTELKAAEEVTIEFAVPSALDSNGYPVLLDADIDFLTAGQSQHRRITLSPQGTSISGLADLVDVSVSAKAPYVPQDWAFPSLTAPLPIAMRTGLGTRPQTTEPPILTVWNYDSTPSSPSEWIVAPGAVVTIPIPQHVGAVSAMVFEVATSHLGGYAPDDTSHLVIAERVTQNVTYDIARYYGNQWFTLAPEADTLTIYNLNTLDSYLVRPVFGIDG